MLILLVSLCILNVLALSACGVALHRATVALRTSDPIPSKEERVAQLRGVIQGTKAIELTLGQNPVELAAVMILAVERARAARAREELRALGVEA